jgi:hypothetical protein
MCHLFGACLFALALAALSANAQTAGESDGEIRAACLNAPVRSCVLELARRIAGGAEKEHRGKYLSEVAQAQANAGLLGEADATAMQALQEVESLGGNFGHDEVLIGVAKVWTKLGKFAEATRLADRINNAYVRSVLLSSIAVDLGRAGRIADGLELVQAIQEKRGRDLAVRQVAWDLRFIALERGEEGMLVSALRFVEIEEERLRAYSGVHHDSELVPALLIITEALALTGRRQEAWQLALRVRKKPELWEVLGHTAGIFLNAGDIEALLRNVQELDEKTRQTVLQDVLEPSVFVRRGALSEFGEIEDIPEAVKVRAPGLSEALHLSQSFTDKTDRDFAAGIVAVAQARAGGIAEAQTAARAIGDGKARYFALRAIGRAQASAGSVAKPAASFGEALEIARNFEAKPHGSGMRDVYLSQLAIDQANVGQIAGARRVLEAMDGNQSSASVSVDGKIINGDFERRSALYYIAKAEGKAGKPKEALETAHALKLGPSGIGLGKGMVAEGLAEGGWIGELLGLKWDPKALAVAAKRCVAAGRLADALQIAHAIASPEWKAQALAVTGQALARAGQKGEAAAAFAGAVQAALSISYDWKVSRLVFIAGKMPE